MGKASQGLQSSVASSSMARSRQTGSSQSSAPIADDYDEEDDDLPVAVDFFSFALLVSQTGEDVDMNAEPDEMDVRSDGSGTSADSHAELELAPHSELFHAPLCNIKHVDRGLLSAGN